MNIRTVKQNNEIWYNLADISATFDLYNPRQLADRIRNAETRKIRIFNGNKETDVWHTDIEGLRELANMPWTKPHLMKGAEELRNWIIKTETGRDLAGLSRIELLEMALQAEKARLRAEEERRIALELLEEAAEAQIEETPQPKAIEPPETPSRAEKTASVDTTKPLPMAEVAKMLGISRIKLFKQLREQRILREGGEEHNTPFKKYAKHFEVNTYPYFDRKAQDTRIGHVTLVKPESVSFIAQRLGL